MHFISILSLYIIYICIHGYYYIIFKFKIYFFKFAFNPCAILLFNNNNNNNNNKIINNILKLLFNIFTII